MRRAFFKYVISLLLFFVSPWGLSESVPQFLNKEEAIRAQMVTISRELGVTCTECHNVQNFADSSKKSFKVSLQHMKLTQLLKENGFNGEKKQPLATCYMCHRGKLIPDYKDPLANKVEPRELGR